MADQCGERTDVVLDDKIGVQLFDNLAETIVDVHRALNQCAHGRLDKRRELLDRRLAELGRGSSDEVLPELAGSLLNLGCWAKAHQALLEPACFERAGEGLLEDEHDANAALLQDLADADAVIGGSVGPFWKKDHRWLIAHPAPLAALRVRGSGRERQALNVW